MVDAVRACVRCGVKRMTHSKIGICKDCRYTMSDEEIAIWTGKRESVELSHEMEAA